MSTEGQETFEEGFRAAISASLCGEQAGDSVRERLLERLRAEPETELPPGVTQESIAHFEGQLQEAVAGSSDWAPPEDVVLRTEQRVSEEIGLDLLSERSVRTLISQGDEEAAPAGKVRYLKTFQRAVEAGLGRSSAPEAVRQRIVEAVGREANKVVSIENSARRSAWTRTTTAIVSLAASLAVIFGLFWSGAETALARNVRDDHRHCAGAAAQMSPRPAFGKTLMSRYGAVPVPQVVDSWELKVTNLCPDSTGRTMVHYVYCREGQETLSVHFIPPSDQARNLSVAEPTDIHLVERGEFPVLAWRQGPWLCTACSPDLDAEALRSALKI